MVGIILLYFALAYLILQGGVMLYAHKRYPTCFKILCYVNGFTVFVIMLGSLC